MMEKLDSEFNDEENKLEMADTQAEIILSQGRTLQQRKEDLFDEYERFRAIGNESIHMGLWYPKDSGFELKAFADADYAGCHDT
ncbi:hypothetical protein Tco_0220475, partial [Tanacetum coccineum]